MRHGTDADGLAAELDSAEKRRAYVESFYKGRRLAAPGAFDAETAAFHSEPYADDAVFRTAIAFYEAFFDPAKLSEPPLVAEPNQSQALVLHGVEDHVVGPLFPRRMEVACEDLVGPYLVEGAGHFLQWERPRLFNAAVRSFCGDLLACS
jgi:pimeloyl-ACP methyl ester carboxylesterase